MAERRNKPWPRQLPPGGEQRLGLSATTDAGQRCAVVLGGYAEGCLNATTATPTSGSYGPKCGTATPAGTFGAYSVG